MAAPLLASPAVANAQGDTPTAEQIEQAKKLFTEAQALYEGKKFAEAGDKFKEAYKLSKKPLLLYYTGLCAEEQGQKEQALIFYRKFTADAPAGTQFKKEAADRIKALENDIFAGATTTTVTTTTPDTTKPPTTTPEVKVKIKPAGTYTAEDVQHQVIEDAPPGQPLDVTAVVPNDSGFVVTLFYRPAGEEKFTAKVMRKRYNELVARMPVDTFKVTSVHYYIETKDQAGTVVDRRGKPSSPNIIYLDAAVPPRFYPDWRDDGGAEDNTATGSMAVGGDDEDPLSKRKKVTKPRVVGLTKAPEGNGKTNYAKWGATGAAGVFLAVGVVFYMRGVNSATAIEDEAQTSQTNGCDGKPCQFDDYLQGVESTGNTANTLTNVGFGLGIATAGVAGYLWYKDLRAQKRARQTALVAPTLAPGYAGAAAQFRF